MAENSGKHLDLIKYLEPLGILISSNSFLIITKKKNAPYHTASGSWSCSCRLNLALCP